MHWSSPLRAAGRVALLTVIPTALGCAYFARQPDSPARHVSFQDSIEPGPSDERHYLLVFGSQSTPKLPRYTHTWVTFVRARSTPGQVPRVLEAHSISWMPATLDIHPWRFSIEPGVNLTLKVSVRMAMDSDERVSLWGPFEIPAGLYRKLLIQKQFLESGEIGYQCIDTTGETARTGRGSNCIHAISDADSLFRRQAYPLAYFGESASLHIVRLLAIRGLIPDPDSTHDALIPALGLDQYPIVRRAYTPPLVPELSRFAPGLP
jgi:hypothetical protein